MLCQKVVGCCQISGFYRGRTHVQPGAEDGVRLCRAACPPRNHDYRLPRRGEHAEAPGEGSIHLSNFWNVGSDFDVPIIEDDCTGREEGL